VYATVYLSDTASECVCRSYREPLTVVLRSCWCRTGTVKCHRSKLVTCARW